MRGIRMIVVETFTSSQPDLLYIETQSHNPQMGEEGRLDFVMEDMHGK